MIQEEENLLIEGKLQGIFTQLAVAAALEIDFQHERDVLMIGDHLPKRGDFLCFLRDMGEIYGSEPAFRRLGMTARDFDNQYEEWLGEDDWQDAFLDPALYMPEERE